MANSIDATVAEHTRYLIENARTMAAPAVGNDNVGAMRDMRLSIAILEAERARLSDQYA